MIHFPAASFSFCRPELFHGIFHLTISQSIDERVQHRGDNAVKQSQRFINGQGRRRSDIHKNTGHKEEDHNSNLGATGGQGFASPYLTMILQGAQNDPIGDE